MIPLFKVYMSEAAIEASANVLRSGFIGQGPIVKEFEADLKKHFKNNLVATTNAATSAEHLALHLLKRESSTWPGLQEGDEVLCTPLTCTATNWPVLANNLNIKWVDIDKNNLNMDLTDLERKITKHTKVIFVVHWGGYPIDLDKIVDIQNRAQVTFGFRPMVIEDCAHAMGSTYKGEPLGYSHNNFCTFSLQAIKHITAVDGGILISPTLEYHKRAKLLRWYGINRDSNRKDFRCEEDISEWGFKFHMNDVNASIGKENFKHLDEIVNKQRNNAAFYDKELVGIKDVTLLERNSTMNSSFWLYSLLVERKTDFMLKMKQNNIMVSQVHERNDIHSCVSNFKTLLPNLNEVQQKLISIPVGWWVTKEQREFIVSIMKEGW